MRVLKRREELTTGEVRKMEKDILLRRPELQKVLDTPPTSILGCSANSDVFADTAEEFVAEYGNEEEKELLARHFDAIRRRFAAYGPRTLPSKS